MILSKRSSHVRLYTSALAMNDGLECFVHPNLWRIEYSEYLSARGEPSFGEAPRTPGIAVKEAHATREDLVEATVTQIDLFELCDNKQTRPSRLRRISHSGVSQHQSFFLNDRPR